MASVTFLKPVDLDIAVPQAQEPGWSIATQLTLLYTLSAFTLLAVATGALYWALTQGLENEDRQFLVGRIHELRQIIGTGGDDVVLLRQEIAWESSEAQDTSLRLYLRVIDANGNVIAETLGMGIVAPIAVFPAPFGFDLPADQPIERHLNGEQTYLLAAAWAEAKSVAQRRQIQVALDVSRDEALIARYRRNLAIVLFLGLIASAALGNIVARRGMRPLAEITRTAERISASKLHERIDPTHWPAELTALATAFDAMLHRLEDSFRRLSQFSADLAHELRTPINNLMGETEVALSRSRSTGEYQQTLESSLEEQRRLAHTVDSLLFLARVDSVSEAIRRCPINARKEIEVVCEFFAAAAEEQGVQLSCAGQSTIYADSALLRRALSNLVSNSLRHTSSGGQIVLSVERPNEHTFAILVRDTGTGISSVHLPHIFDRFYRVDAERSCDQLGAGLGLAIVKSIMTLHQGDACLKSEAGKGTLATLTFPTAF